MLTKEQLKKIKKTLPRGYFREITERVPYSEKTVANFFSGKSYHIEIHEAVLEMAGEYKEKLEKIQAQSRKLEKDNAGQVH